jgi:hypothetical protein
MAVSEARRAETKRMRQAQAAHARKVLIVQSAHRAVDDPAVLARAARIVRAALARKVITLADLTPLPAEGDSA